MNTQDPRIVIEGAGLRAKTPEDVALTIQILSGMFASHGMGVRLETNPESPPFMEDSWENLTPLDDLRAYESHLFEQGDKKGVREARGLWTGLRQAFFDKVQHPGDDDCPVEFIDNPRMAAHLGDADERFQFMATDSLTAAAEWLIKNPARAPGVSRGHIRLLVGYVNAALQPEQPLSAEFSRPAPAATVEQEAGSAVREPARYLDKAVIDGKGETETEPLQLVTVESVKRFAMERLGLRDKQCQPFYALIDTIAEELGGSLEPPDDTMETTRQVNEGLYFLGTRPGQFPGMSPRKAVWGVSPQQFAEVFDRWVDGKISGRRPPGEITVPRVLAYIAEIDAGQTPSE